MTSLRRLNRVMQPDVEGPFDSPARSVGPKVAADGATRRNFKIPFVLVLVALTVFLPVELSFYFLGLRLTATRLIFLAITPLLVIKFIQKAGSGRYRFVFSDIFIILTGFWLIYAPAKIDGLSLALNHAGPDILEFCGGYMTTRIILGRHYEALRFIGLLCRIIAFVALLGLIDPLIGSYATHNLARQLTGFSGPDLWDWNDRFRLGLLRAAGPIEHPILYAFICATGLLFAANVPISSRKFVMGSCSLGMIFAFSSAPEQCALLALGLVFYGRLTVGLRMRWVVLIGAGVAGIVTAFLISDSPVGFIISHLTFDPSSGYYRYWTWDRVIFYVSQSPWYGLGYGVPPDEINHSIDSLWLVLSVRGGVPGAVLVFFTLIGSTSLSTSGRGVSLTHEESQLGTALGIIIFLTLYIAFTVDLWGSVWILVGLLVGTRAHLGELGQLRADQPPSAGRS